MKELKLRLLAFTLLFQGILFAAGPPDEGMWLPLLLKDYNYAEMQKLGLKLSADQIYSINNSSLKDAIVQLGGFCTAEVISDQGLLLTNHHCGYDAIASQSSEEHNYLDDGFWAMNKAEELPIEGLSVTFLVKMVDVTDRVSSKEEAEMETEMKAIEKELAEGNEFYKAEVKRMFDGNAFYAFVYETYTDIRLVGAPPSSIGKFGGDTDNWMWPRHTGDFSMFRIYSSKDNKPADFSAENIPFTPKHYLPVSTAGLSEGDFTMIMGYPGSTDRYLTSPEVSGLQKNTAPVIVEVLGKRLEIMKTEMDKSEAVRIAHASDYASLANSHKYYKGQLRGLKKFDLISQQESYEADLQKWIDADEDRKAKYGTVIKDMKAAHETHKQGSINSLYVNVAGFAPTFISNGFSVWGAQRLLGNENATEEQITTAMNEVQAEATEIFSAMNETIDRNIFVMALDYLKQMPEGARMDLFESKLYTKKCKGSNEAFADLVFKKSMLTNENLISKFTSKPSMKAIDKDPGMLYLNSLITLYQSKIAVDNAMMDAAVEPLRKLYVQAIQEKENKNFYPDANFTMRLTYGTVKPYNSWEGKPFETFTYASQILDKYKAGDEEFDVPEKLRTLIKNKDYGSYANGDGTLTVCFLHNTDITGGNSGSPVINANGELVGCAFDGNWESMTSDLFWQDEYVRTISVDIRYVLFVIDKFAGAGHLVEEMTLVK